MTQQVKKYKRHSPETTQAERNCRIVWLHNKGTSFTQLGQMFGLTSQRTHTIYNTWKDRPEVTVFEYDNGDKIL